MKRDIETRSDIERLLTDFYSIAMADSKIGHHFRALNLEHHLPMIANFWEKILLGNPVYFNNPLSFHQVLHAHSPLLPEHFTHWVSIFTATVDRLFEGETADLAKSRANSIAGVLDQKLNGGVKIEKRAR